MCDNELISVIIPVYNVEKYLNKCIDSIVNQTYKNLEVILVDDGSLDKSSQLCDEWAKRDNRINVIHKVNGGLSSARNYGLKISKGEYISFVDSDDWVDKNTYQELLCHTKKDIDFVSFGVLEEYDTETYQILNSNNYQIYKQKQIFNRILDDNSVAGYVCNKLFKRSIIGNEKFDETLMSCEDIDFCTRISVMCNSIIHVDAKFYHYRRRNDSMTGEYKYNPYKLSVLTAYENIMPIFFKYDVNDYYKLERNYLKIALNIKGRMIVSKVKDDLVLTRLNDIINKYFAKVVMDSNNSIIIKANIVLTRFFPSLLLKIKQYVLSKRRGLNDD